MVLLQHPHTRFSDWFILGNRTGCWHRARSVRNNLGCDVHREHILLVSVLVTPVIIPSDLESGTTILQQRPVAGLAFCALLLGDSRK